MDTTSKSADGTFNRLLRGLIQYLRALLRGLIEVARALLRWLGVALILFVLAVLAVILTNAFISVPYNVAFRALDPDSPACRTSGQGWTVLAEVGNDERRAIESRCRPG